MNKDYSGMFITFEGCEGSGKTTHIASLAEFLRNQGYPVLLTREPGGSAISEKIRDILLDCGHEHMTEVCELLLYQAARAQIVQEIILPSLREGNIVLCDRFQDATYAYQGYGAGIELSYIQTIAQYPGASLIPDLTILMDIDVTQGLDRSISKDRMDQKSVAFHHRVREGYLQLAQHNPQRMKVVQVKEAFPINQEKIRRHVLDVITAYKNK